MSRKLLIGLAVLGIALVTLGVITRRAAAPADDVDGTDGIDFETATADVEA